MPASQRPRKLGQILLDRGLISEGQLIEALRVQERTPKMLGEILVEMRYVQHRDVLQALAEQLEQFQ